jgi:mannitol/fructose-specific phosphotransferase system IIA component (Ntr-type)
VIFVLGLIALMLFYVVRGIPHVAMENLTPFTPYGIHRTLATAGFVFVAYGGLIQISGVAEEVRDPSRVIPRGIALSLIVVTILYVLMVWVTSGVLPAGQLDGSRTPITDGAAMFMAPWGVRLIGVAAILAFVSTANAGILSSSRYLYALSRDELLPPGLARLLPKTGVPFIAVIVTGLFISAALFLPLTILVESASLVLLLGFMMACICVIVLRESKVQNYRPSYAAPFYPFLQILGLLGYGLLLVELGIEAYVICAILFVVGFAVYQFYGRHRLAQDYALLHLVERITSKAFASGTLEQELKVIIRERDEIQTDRFDDVVAHALVLDLEKDLNLAEALDKAAEELSERLSLSAENLKSRFAAREAESSTVLTPFLAIPHIIIPGEHEFQIALVRARAGIRVEGTDERVHALFALVGTRDERNFHLLTLANLAQIVQDPQFEKRWLAARGEQGIRDVILLAKRQRAQTIKSEAF